MTARKKSVRKASNNEEETIGDQLEDVKRLLLLLLLKLGATQDEIAVALRVSQPSVSRMVPKPKQRFRFTEKP